MIKVSLLTHCCTAMLPVMLVKQKNYLTYVNVKRIILMALIETELGDLPSSQDINISHQLQRHLIQLLVSTTALALSLCQTLSSHPPPLCSFMLVAALPIYLGVRPPAWGTAGYCPVTLDPPWLACINAGIVLLIRFKFVCFLNNVLFRFLDHCFSAELVRSSQYEYHTEPVWLVLGVIVYSFRVLGVYRILPSDC